MKWIGQNIYDLKALFRQDVTIEGNLTVAGTTTSFGDSDKINLGDGSDLQLYHDGSNSYIDQTGTGDNIFMVLITPNRNYEFFFDAEQVGVNGSVRLSASAFADMDATEVATITARLSGIGADTADIITGQDSWWSGFLVA